jgi:hypothetical protein
MSTALSHHRRIPTATAGAAVLAVVAAGVVLGVVRDHDSGSGTSGTEQNTVGQTFKLKGTSHEQGNWDHAGTTSGGKTQPGL